MRCRSQCLNMLFKQSLKGRITNVINSMSLFTFRWCNLCSATEVHKGPNRACRRFVSKTVCVLQLLDEDQAALHCDKLINCILCAEISSRYVLPCLQCLFTTQVTRSFLIEGELLRIFFQVTGHAGLASAWCINPTPGLSNETQPYHRCRTVRQWVAAQDSPLHADAVIGTRKL